MGGDSEGGIDGQIEQDMERIEAALGEGAEGADGEESESSSEDEDALPRRTPCAAVSGLTDNRLVRLLAAPSVERPEFFFVLIAPGIHRKSILSFLVGGAPVALRAAGRRGPRGGEA